jgi:hypothetical protein
MKKKQQWLFDQTEFLNTASVRLLVIVDRLGDEGLCI